MQIEELGYAEYIKQLKGELILENFDVGRVAIEHKERYIVKKSDSDVEAEITGNLRFTAKSREDFPAVGDWVAISLFDSHQAVIHKVLPRKSIIKRQAVGQTGEYQVIAANIDYAFILQAIDRDYSINRLERYLTICYTSSIEPIIVLTKIDLLEDDKVNEIVTSIASRIKNAPLIAVSNHTLSGYNEMKGLLEKGKTYCMLGSSGVGKSTLLNNLAGKTLMQTDEISITSNRGKHVTTHRELVVLENGSILIDNPGMREVGVTESTSGIEAAFDSIHTLSLGCKFKDCTHTSEVGCAVMDALENEELDRDSYENYLKIERERTHFETSALDKRRKERVFGKIIKNYKKDMEKNSG